MVSIVVERSDGKTVSQFVLAAWGRATAAPLPAFALLVGPSSHPSARTDRKRRLLVLCFELARTRKGGRFSLSQIDAAAVLGVGQRLVSGWLREFQRRGFIAHISRGSHATGLASEYRWVHRDRPRTRGGRAATPVGSTIPAPAP